MSHIPKFRILGCDTEVVPPVLSLVGAVVRDLKLTVLV
jgi:hypothetical protein